MGSGIGIDSRVAMVVCPFERKKVAICSRSISASGTPFCRWSAIRCGDVSNMLKVTVAAIRNGGCRYLWKIVLIYRILSIGKH